jgi:uncharacterized protein (TIGR02466 family)
VSELTNANYTNLFTSPLLSHVWSDAAELRDELIQCILTREKTTAGVAHTNVGGWHSEIGRLEFCGEAGQRVVRQMYEMADEATRRLLAECKLPLRSVRWTLEAWANVSRVGHFNRTHTHAGTTWSGTYYVDPGDPPPEDEYGTPIHFFDPCQGRSNTFMTLIVPISVLIRPEPGLMIIFPSYVPHMVYPHRGSRPRISIAFNLRKEPYP